MEGFLAIVVDLLNYFIKYKTGSEKVNNYIFDFDGTLADSELCSVIATQEAFRSLV